MWSRRDFDDLLVPPLDRAIALEEMDGVALGVGEDLHLDAPRAAYGLLNERSRVAERAFASRMAAVRDSRSVFGSSTRRMPRPPPPATALTNRGKPIPSAPATSSSMFADGAVDLRVGTPAALAASRARTLLPASSRTPAGGPTKTMPASAHERARSGFSLRNP